jgi:putative tryptophan/tyrosine transport system substrate-binding protein
LQQIEDTARTVAVQVHPLDIRAFKDIEEAFHAVRKARPDALIVLSSTIIHVNRAQVAALASKNRLPAMYAYPDQVDAGGLVTYSVNLDDLYRRAATYVDKILKGANPAHLPVEQPFKFDLVINLKAAKQIGLEVPMSMLARADRVIQ